MACTILPAALSASSTDLFNACGVIPMTHPLYIQQKSYSSASRKAASPRRDTRQAAGVAAEAPLPPPKKPAPLTARVLHQRENLHASLWFADDYSKSGSCKTCFFSMLFKCKYFLFVFVCCF